MAVGDKLVTLDGLKAVYSLMSNDMNGIKDTVNGIAGGEIVVFNDGGYMKNGSTNDYTGKPVSNADWQWAKVSCVEGDTFGLKHLKGGSTGRIYAFFTSEEAVIGSPPIATTNIANYTEITAPENAAFVVFNNKKTEYSDAFIIKNGTYIRDDVDDIKDRLTAVETVTDIFSGKRILFNNDGTVTWESLT